jgi:glycosyltransferase involved in cell wall biosynthesis
MKVHFICYADDVYAKTQQNLLLKARTEFDVVQGYDDTWLKTTDFAKKNKHILEHSRGAGFCSWKPYVIKTHMDTMEDDDILVYMDVSDIFYPGSCEFIKRNMVNGDMAYHISTNVNALMTKRDAFILMNCDQHKYWSAFQLEAGAIVYRKNKNIASLLNEYMYYSQDINIIGCDKQVPNITKDNFPYYYEHRHDQSVLTNLTIKYGIKPAFDPIRQRIFKCDVNHVNDEALRVPHAFDTRNNALILTYLQQLRSPVEYSINVTVHNKDFLIAKVLDSIIKNTTGSYELVVVLDGCTDNSETVVKKYLNDLSVPTKIIYAPDVFETMSNNIAIRNSSGNFIVIIQDDILVQEYGYNERLALPVKNFHDVFAVSGNASHNYVINHNSIDLRKQRNDCWSDILTVTDIANKSNTSRNIFAIRNSVNRGPTLIHKCILDRLGLFDESFAPQDMDDHDLCYRAFKQFGKKCGFLDIGFQSDLCWGGTRENGKPRPFVLNANQKNTRIMYNRHKDLLQTSHNANYNIDHLLD